jgi:membrane-associated PAP2 superfamily phosphatase
MMTFRSEPTGIAVSGRACIAGLFFYAMKKAPASRRVGTLNDFLVGLITVYR